MTETHAQAGGKAKAPDLTPPVTGNGSQKKEAGAKKEKTPKEPAVPRESNFAKVYPPTATITLLTEGGKNPKRPDSKAFARFAFYKDGGTVEAFLKAGGTYADISWDVGHGFIKVSA